LSAGTLYLCATPIGNLEDITIRVLRILKEVNLIAAEDTRRTRKLLSYYDIHTPLTSFHRHNYRKKGVYILNLLLEGQSVALVSDAGLPGIADPGEEMVLLAVAHDIPVVPVPGPNAALAALVASGLPAKYFCFEGFLPSKARARQERLRQLQTEGRTLIFYEAPHRLPETLADMLVFFKNRKIVVARELTKLHEEIWRGTIVQAVTYFDPVKTRGEFTLVVAGSTEPDSTVFGTVKISEPAVEKNILGQVRQLEDKGLAKQEAIRQVARQYNLSRREVYALVIQAKNGRKVEK
jgi:16S rRNA (cytidine1402-2'-O)-methyltransferase